MLCQQNILFKYCGKEFSTSTTLVFITHEPCFKCVSKVWMFAFDIIHNSRNEYKAKANTKLECFRQPLSVCHFHALRFELKWKLLQYLRNIWNIFLKTWVTFIRRKQPNAIYITNETQYKYNTVHSIYDKAWHSTLCRCF